MTEEKLYIIDGKCWKCNKPMKVAIIRGDFEKRGGTTVGPDQFSEAELKLATDNEVLIKEQFSFTVSDSYLANTCVQCGNFAGSFYLFTSYFHPAEMGNYTFKTFDLPLK